MRRKGFIFRISNFSIAIDRFIDFLTVFGRLAETRGVPEPQFSPEPEPRQWSQNSIFFGRLGAFFCIFRLAFQLMVTISVIFSAKIYETVENKPRKSWNERSYSSMPVLQL